MFSNARASTLLLDEYFASQDPRFLDQLRTVNQPKHLAGLADRWKKDPRPWAREQILAYLDLPLDRPGHHPVVKRLFKQAEQNRDDALMAALLVAFDRLVRRRLRKRWRYNWQTRQSWQEDELFSPRDQILAKSSRTAQNPRTSERIEVPLRPPRTGRLFSYPTRHYIRRRAWRYFRRMGFQRPADYPAAVAAALARYRDEDLAQGENILDNWALMHACFGRHDAIQCTVSQVRLKDDRGMNELSAAPCFPDLWKKPQSAPVLLSLVVNAHSRLVRVWAIQLLRRDHQDHLAAMQPDELLRLLDHDDGEVQQLGASILEHLSGLERWPLATWLRLLETRNTTALATICDAMARHVSSARLDTTQCVTLACAAATPVARLGLSFLKGRPLTTYQDKEILVGLAAARCTAAGREIAAMALEILGAADAYNIERISPFFDSLNPEVRAGAWLWLRPETPGYNDAALWSRLLETPFDDVRLHLVDVLELRGQTPSKSNGAADKKAIAPALQRDDLTPIWTAVLLGIHRGGRHKLKALRQISQALADSPERAEKLLPVVAVAARSVRPTEMRSGLAALVTAVERRPELMDLLKQHLPELEVSPQEAAR